MNGDNIDILKKMLELENQLKGLSPEERENYLRETLVREETKIQEGKKVEASEINLKHLHMLERAVLEKKAQLEEIEKSLKKSKIYIFAVTPIAGAAAAGVALMAAPVLAPLSGVFFMAAACSGIWNAFGIIMEDLPAIRSLTREITQLKEKYQTQLKSLPAPEAPQPPKMPALLKLVDTNVEFNNQAAQENTDKESKNDTSVQKRPHSP